MQGLFLTQRSVQVHRCSQPLPGHGLLSLMWRTQSRAGHRSTSPAAFPPPSPAHSLWDSSHKQHISQGQVEEWASYSTLGPTSDERAAWSCPVTLPSSLRGPLWHLAHQTASAWHMWGDPAVLLGVPQSERPLHTSFYPFFLRAMCLKANRRHFYGRHP